MALDTAQNFVRGTVDSAISQGDTTISVTDASAFPDPSSEGDYNLVLWDQGSHNIPDNDPNVEIVRVTARDTGTNDLTVTRGQESTADADHPDTSVLQMAWTAKMRDDTQTEINNAYNITAVDDTDSPYTTSNEQVITADTSSAGVTVTLATADVSNDSPITVVNISGSNAVTVNTEGGETIDPDGDSSKSWSTEGWAVTFTPDGSNWDSTLDADYESVTTDEIGSGGGVTSTDITDLEGPGIQVNSSNELESDVDTPQDVSGSRSLGTWFENSTGDPLVVSVRVNVGGGSHSAGDVLRIFGDNNDSESGRGYAEDMAQGNGTASVGTSIFMVVGTGDHYRVRINTDDSGSASLSAWFESQFGA